METFPENLRQLLGRYRGRKWIFMRPLGNWGDHLIWSGAESMADSLGIDWKSCETSEFHEVATTPDHCIYLQGSGGYNRWCSGTAFENIKLALSRQVHCVIQGPATVADDREWLLQRFRSVLGNISSREFYFAAREEVTHRLLRELFIKECGMKVFLDDDTALALDAKDLLRIAELKSMPNERYDLFVLREDKECPGGEATDPTLDRTVPPSGISLDPAYVAESFCHWVRMHLCARSIVTNRLHSSIIGTIAGKDVSLGPGSYHKNRSVWEYSLAGRGVRWIETIQPPAEPLWRMLPSRIRKSYKVGRLRLALNRVPLQ